MARLPARAVSSVVVGRTAIYAAAGDGRLVALTLAGRRTWEFRTGNGQDDVWSASVGGDGTIYLPSRTGKLFALSPQGEVRWSCQTHSPLRGSPVLGSDGTIFVADQGGNVHAVSSNGKTLWLHRSGWKNPPATVIQSEAPPAADVAIGFGGTLYCEAVAGRLDAVTKEGRLKWSTPIRGRSVFLDTPLVGDDGTLYVLSTEDVSNGSSALSAMTPLGKVKWTHAVGLVEAALGSAGDVYVVDSPDSELNVAALRGDGSVRWRFNVTAAGLGNPGAVAVDGRATAYCVSSNPSNSGGGFVFALTQDGEEMWRLGLAEEPAGKVVIASGTLYVPVSQADGQGAIVAIGEDRRSP